MCIFAKSNPRQKGGVTPCFCNGEHKNNNLYKALKFYPMKKIIIPLLLLLLPLVAVSQDDKITEQYLIMECNAPDALVFFDNQSVSEKFIKQKLGMFYKLTF